MPFVTPSDLEQALSTATYIQIFDDDNDGMADSGPVELVIRRAHAKVLARMPSIYATLPADGSPPDLLWDAELDYAMAFSFERHPEYVRRFGEAMTRADMQMQLLQEGTLQLTDDAPEEAPRNLGGWSVDTSHRVATPDDDGTLNTGDF